MSIPKVFNYICACFLLLSSTFVFGQKLVPKKRSVQPDTTIVSTIMGKNYQLYISFPPGYSAKDTTKYPVLYVLDGWNFFPAFNVARQAMDFGGELQNVIIVGIGCGEDLASWFVNRNYDYTPFEDTASDRSMEKQFGLPTGAIHSGGAPKFLQCITTEIIPYINAQYNTNGEKGIAGHSLGGLFTAWCFLHTKDIFNNYGMSSPSLWFDNQALLKEAATLLNTNPTGGEVPTKIFLCVGGKEGFMVADMNKFSALIEAKTYKNIELTKNIFNGESHLSVVPASLSRTLSVLYGK